MKTLAIVTYNPLFPYQKGMEIINGIQVLFLPETFTPKKPESVLATDPNWEELMLFKYELEKVIIFAGKKSSGALEIIRLACISFSNKKSCLFFVLCDHELEEKEALLARNGIAKDQYVTFRDGHLLCQEAPILKGYMHEHIDKWGQ